MAESPSAPPSLPVDVILAIAHDVLQGLHAAHEATDERGKPMGLVHRDVSPQNIMVGIDGRARVLDFGVAKAAGATHTTETGVIKGKLAYMSPEQVYGEKLDRRADIYALGVVLWEMLAGRRLFVGHDQKTAIGKVLNAPIQPPGMHRPVVPPIVDEMVMRALDRDVAGRYATALEMAEAIEGMGERAAPAEVARWVQGCAGERLAAHATLVSGIESVSAATVPDVTKELARRESEPEPPMASRYIAYALVVGIVLIVAWQILPSTPPTTGATSATPVISAAPTMTVSLAATSSPGSSAATAALSASPSASATANEVAPPVSSSTARSSRIHRPARPPATSRPATTPSVNCNPPYVVDAKGHKRYKRGCLK
jgi:serine/threonine-protein kinase